MMTRITTINEHLAASPVAYVVIRAEEGLLLVAYKCPAGIWTIGYGHTKGVRPGMRINTRMAERFLREDVTEAEGYVKRLATVPLTQGQFDALVSFVFNLGPDGLGGSTLLKKLNAGDYAGAAGEFGKWVNGGKPLRPLPGLVRRRAKERDLFEGIQGDTL